MKYYGVNILSDKAGKHKLVKVFIAKEGQKQK